MSTRGGEPGERDVMGYKTPQGPKGIENRQVGLGGANVGNCGTQGPAPSRGDGAGGSVGLGGTNHGNKVNQGKH